MRSTFSYVVGPAVVASLAFGCGPYRSVDGSGNNRNHPEWGSADEQLLRQLPSDYGDGVSTLAGQSRPNPRVISNIVAEQTGSVANVLGASDFVWQWGQFVDHDIDLTEGTAPAELEPIPVPAGDPFFDPFNTGTEEIDFNRSIFDLASGTGPGNPRQQLNQISAYIDASNVYGSDAVRAAALRKNDGSGELETSAGDLLPFNIPGLPNAGGPGAELFLAGDVRANEQVGLTSMHTLFVREHNRIATIIRYQFQHWSGEQVYQAARKIVGAEIQAITFREYLPALLGPFTPEVKGRYKKFVNAGIANHFSTALFRYGHSQLNPQLLRLDDSGNEIPAGNLDLRDAFFNPDEVSDHGIEPLLLGLASQVAQRADNMIIDDVRNFLFGPPGSGGLDLAALNIQRGRDHGLPSYNDTRAALGLSQAVDYDDISSDLVVQQRLEAAYGVGNVDDVDLWVGSLCEDRLPGALVGPLIAEALLHQFERLRDGDRFWYRRNLGPGLVRMVESMTLARIIRANTPITSIQDDVFHVN